MGRRLKLQQELEELLGSRNVYFQPPESKKLNYDCIIYNRPNIEGMNANNNKYKLTDRYDVMFIYRNPDSEMPHKILEHFSYCSHNRHFVADNLYHDVFSLYY